MAGELFSERERGPTPRTAETISERAWGGLFVQVNKRMEDGSFGAGFPSQCPDGYGVDGCNAGMLEIALKAEINIDWPLRVDRLPDDELAVWDMLEFLYQNVGRPVQGAYHSFYRHHHLSFEIEEGQRDFAQAVNRVLSRNGIAFELTNEGLIRRLLPEILADQMASKSFRTGDTETDRLLEAARAGIKLPGLPQRRDALEKLWDGFERLKTLEPGLDKKASADALLNKVECGSSFRMMLGTEAAALTVAGNTFRIRHSEAKQEILQTAEQVDYLFFRMFAFLELSLRSSGRGG